MPKPLTILILVFCISACQTKDRHQLAIDYLEQYHNMGFEQLSAYLSDSVTIVDGEYRKAYSLEEFQTYYEWDSAFCTRFDIMESSALGNDVTLKLSSESIRFEYLENSPFITRQKLSFKDNKIYQIEIEECISADWNVWILRRDSLVEWIKAEHPELNGFIYDMSKAGAENYIKAIELYNNQ